MKVLSRVGVALLAVASFAASAAPLATVATADVTGTMTNQLGPIAAVGVAVMAVVVATRAFKWVRSALS